MPQATFSQRMNLQHPIMRPLAIALLAFLLNACDSPRTSPSFLALGDSVLRVTSTIQYPDNKRPWLKKQPFTRIGLGTVISGGRLLVTADMVAHSTYIGLEKPEDGPKGTAVVEAIDEECNLAVLRPVDPAILAGTRPLLLDGEVRTGSTLQILQLEPNGVPAVSPATVTTIAVMPYPSDSAAYLLYRVSTTIPQREGSFVIPAIRDGKLAGLVMRYDPRTQSAEIIPSPLIARFLKESAKPDYAGLARVGLTWDEARGPALREWLGARDLTGVYVTSVDPQGPAEKGGLQKGDLLTKIARSRLDGEGSYSDPTYGKVTFNNLATLESSPGDQLEIEYFRSSGEGTGTLGTTKVTLAGRNPSLELSTSRQEGDSVPFTFLGGLLFQELSRPYLREWGANWKKEAPQNLLYLDQFQEEQEHPRDRKRFVILTAVLPSEQTIGIQDLSNRLVTSINGYPIHELNDVGEAVRHPERGFHRIELEGEAGPIFLDAATLQAEEERIRTQYGIPLKGKH